MSSNQLIWTKEQHNELSHVHHAILAMHKKNWTNKKLPEKLFNIADS
jgi:hypothetical protein